MATSFTPMTLLAATLFVAATAAADESTGSIWGRVTSGADGDPIANVRVEIRAPELTVHRETRTDAVGAYLFGELPPGDYVVSVEHAGYVTSKHTLHLEATRRMTVDARLVPAGRPMDAIVVAIEPLSFPRSQGLTDTYDAQTLDWLPVTGRLSSALSLAAGPLGQSTDGALVAFDGAPSRLGDRLLSRRVLNPGLPALQEVTVSTTALAADVGRTDVGLISVITRPGGDRLNGDVRAVFSGAAGDSDVVDAARDASGIGTALDFRIGGPLDGRRSWLFAAGRTSEDSFEDSGRLGNEQFSTDTIERFWEIKATHALNAAHRLEGLLLTGSNDFTNAAPPGAISVENEGALEDRTESHRLLSAVYTGVFADRVQVSARVTGERAEIDRDGRDEGALVDRTSVRDQQTGALMFASGNCVDCVSAADNGRTWRLSASGLGNLAGLHEITGGYEGSLGHLRTAGVPSGGAFELRASRFVVAGNQVRPVFETNGSTLIVWRPGGDDRLTYSADGFFIGDVWRTNRNITVQAGLRWDRHRLSQEDADVRILTENAFSPRLSVAWSPPRTTWLVTGGYAQYAADPVRRDAMLSGATVRTFRYQGPAVNVTGPGVNTRNAVSTALNWFLANGGTTRAPLTVFEPGVTVLEEDAERPPYVSEWTVGAGRLIGVTRVRADSIWRTAHVREWRVNPAAPPVTSGNTAVDQANRSTTDRLGPKYAGIAVQAEHDFGIQALVGARYTLSRSWGAMEPAAFGDLTTGITPFAYREYSDLDWAAPEGDLSNDRRHRLKVWAHGELLASEDTGVLSINALQTFESGRPFGFVAPINVQPFVANPGYEQPPLAIPYFFTDRDAFHTEGTRRTDVEVEYLRLVPGTVRTEWLVSFEVLNVFNQREVLNPGAFAAAGTAYTDPSRFASFNPFTQTPVEGVHWAADGRLANRIDDETAVLTMPRAFRVTAGVRF